MRKGFTLIEILLVMTLIGVMLSVVLPVSYSMVKRYQESLEAEKVLMLLSSLRRESFLYSREMRIETQEGGLIMGDHEEKRFKAVFIHADQPILFYKNGTSSGGQLGLRMESGSYLIQIQGPSGDMKLVRQ
ncbi:MAG: type II secretion system protein [Nitrospirota bacterium]